MQKCALILSSSLPALRLTGDFGDSRRVVDRIFARALLRLIILEQPDGIFVQHDDSREIAERHERHCNIGEAPHEIKRHDSPGIDYCSDQQTLDLDRKIIVADETDIRLPVVIIGDDACESEKEDSDAHEYRPVVMAPAQPRVDRMLRQYYSVMTLFENTAAKYDERRRRAH